MTIPNFVTLIRIILTPVFLVCLIDNRVFAALVVFIAASVSDGVDGMIARVFNQKSKIGAYMDPLADKILLITAFLTLAVKGIIPSWLTAAVISRDIIIMLGILILLLNGVTFNMKPSILSKITTCAQLGTICIVLVNVCFAILTANIITLAFFITGILTIVSGLGYMINWFKIINNNLPSDSDAA